MPTRIEELKSAEQKLTRLVQASVAVCNDTTACEMLREAADIHGVAVIEADSLEHRAILALARTKAGIEIETRRIEKSTPNTEPTNA